MARKANPDPAPWEALGLSRRTYFRKKSEGTLESAKSASAKSVPVSKVPKSATAISTSISPSDAKPWLFKPGMSGNPLGRPKQDKTLKELAREYTAEAVLTLAEIMRNEDATDTARALAAEKLLDRGYGKATQHIEANVSHFDKMDLGELRSYVEREIAELGLSDATPEAFGSSPTAH